MKCRVSRLFGLERAAAKTAEILHFAQNDSW